MTLTDYLNQVKERAKTAVDFTQDDFPDDAFELLNTDVEVLVEMVETLLIKENPDHVKQLEALVPGAKEQEGE